MASLALVTAETANAAATNTKAALEAAGHTVTLVDDADLATTDLSGYDAIIVVRQTHNSSSTIAGYLRGYLDDGTPMLLGLTSSTTSGSNSARAATDLGLIGNVDQVSQFGNVRAMTITDNTHPITSGFSIGNVNITTGNDYNAALESTTTPSAGVALGTAVAAFNIEAGASNLIAIEAGTLDLNGNPVNARVVLWGWLDTRQTDYTNDGEALIAAIMDWLLEPAGPAPVNLTARGGVVVGGRAALTVTRHVTARGGVEIGGRVALTKRTGKALAIRGGVEIGGRVRFHVTRKLRVRGGIEIGGRAALTNASQKQLAVRGGLEVGGRVAFSVTKHLSARGGVVVGGRIAFKITRRLRIRGGIIIGSRVRYMGPGTGIVVNGGRLSTAEVLAMSEEGDSYSALQPWGGINGRAGTYTILERTITDERARPEFAFAFDPLSDPDDVPVQRGGGRVRYRPPQRSDPYRAQKRRRRD